MPGRAIMKILLIEDDREMAADIALTLRANGHEVETSGDGRDGAARARNGGHAALIVDRMLPEMDGLSLVRALRAEGIRTPILFLTTMSGIDDRVEGLEGGADDYLTKPFAAPELLARVNAITRRADAHGETTLLKAAGLEMDLIRRTVTRQDRPVTLQAQEFKLLEYLMRNADRVVTRTMLLEHVWDLHFDPRTNIVETHMSRLRTKLDCGLGGEIIRTIRGTGYSLRAH
jgi:two-component system OmpR family response regulator